MIEVHYMKPKLLLHSCCAPCLAGAYDEVTKNFDVTIFWFNPNIYPIEEYNKRLGELKKFCKIKNLQLIIGDKMPADANSWDLLTKKYFKEPEGGKRCRLCIKMRLLYTAQYAAENGFDFFDTTLSVSPHKNSDLISIIAQEISNKTEVEYAGFDFKKNDGHRRSLKLCKELNIYRQKYCGCQYGAKNF